MPKNNSEIHILFKNAGKKFIREWIFRDLNHAFSENTVVLGPNGSGKSTLLQVACGMITPNAGTVLYEMDGKNVSPDEIFRSISFAAPYIELIEEFTLEEHIHFQASLRPFLRDLNVNDIISYTGLERSKNKEIRFFSSGMKQRLKLTLSLAADSRIVFLDEPLSNLDSQGAIWYKEMISEFSGNRLFLIGSNHQEEEYFFVKNQLKITDFKPQPSVFQG